jgi:DNA polymerase I-like protein with 3'-5' exonuclease and polymerase domains
MAKILINKLNELKEAVHELKTHERLSHDTETKGPENLPDISGLFPFHGARSFSHIFATKDDEYYFNFNKGGIDTAHKKLLQPIFDDKDKIIFYVNAIFDATISHFDNLAINTRIVDCPSIARIEYSKHGKNPWDETSFLSLEYLARYYNIQQKDDRVKQYIKEYELYSSEKCRFTGKKIPLYNLVPLELMFEYGCNDARSTYDLGNSIIKCINYKDSQYNHETKMISVAQNEIKLTSILADMKIKGMRTWPEYIEKAITHEKEIYENLHADISKLTGGINLNSGKQIAEYLEKQGIEVPRKDPTDHALKMMDTWLKRAEEFKALGKIKQFNNAIEKAKDYKKGNYITDKKMLATLMKQNPNLDFLSKITKAKEADKKIGTYYSKFMLLKDESNIIHCGLNQEAAKTGRFSANDPNLQNLHKEKWDGTDSQFLIRKSFIADEGCRLFFADYSQQEMVVMLDQAGEMSVIEKLKSGEYEDFYLATASVLKEILGIDISRSEAKAMALGLAYGQGKDLLAKNLGKTPDEAAKFKKEFFNALPKLKRFAQKLSNQVKWHGKIHNAFGRVLYFSEQESYKALNGYVQGTSADITKTSMVLVDRYFKEAGLNSRLSLCVHDELIFNIKIGEEKKALPLIEKAMIEAYPHKHIPLKVDFEYSEINKYGVSPWGEKIAWKG